MSLLPREKDFPYKKFLLRKLFKLRQDDEGERAQEKCFRLFYQELNTSKRKMKRIDVVKFMKIIYFDRKQEPVQAIF